MNVHLLSGSGKIVTKSPTIKRRRSASVENGGGKPDDPISGHDEDKLDLYSGDGKPSPTPELTTFGGIKLGWIQGVLIPCLLNIWGVMLFLRIAWVVAQAGIGLTIVIIALSGAVCVTTTLSLSAICTNGRLQGGGVYYLVSRSLGAELGASVGIIFAFANAVAASMNTIGFCDSLNDLLKSHNLKIIDNSVNDVRIVGAIALFVMCVICAVGMDWETKAQNFLITVIVLAIFNYILGACLGPNNDIARAKGFVGINAETAQTNWMPDFRQTDDGYHDFFSVFAVYFPALTGVQAGANICGDLKDPATAIPKGTLLALVISIASYFAMAMLSGVGAMRDASGATSNMTLAALEACKPNCKYGLHNNYEIMQLMAFWGPLIYGGCWAATLSTALTNLLSVPRLIQALGIDRIYPGLIFFSKPYGRYGEPYRGYVLTFCVSLLFLLIADLNTIAPLITNFYLASYALINFCTFHAAFVQQVSWRPTFRYYNKWLSLLGFIMCATIMLIISWMMALLTTIIFMVLYLLVLYRKPDVNWGSSTEGQRYRDTITFIMQMTQRTLHIKSYNPQLLVLAGSPYARPALLDIADLITKLGSFMIVADINKTELTYTERAGRYQLGEQWLKERKIRAFYTLIHGFDLEQGAKALIQSSGVGRLSPNIILLGYKNNWRTTVHDDLESYYNTVQFAFSHQMPVAIFRVPDSARPEKYNFLPSARLTSSITLDHPLRSHMLAVMHSDSDMEESLEMRKDHRRKISEISDPLLPRDSQREKRESKNHSQTSVDQKMQNQTFVGLSHKYTPITFKEPQATEMIYNNEDARQLYRTLDKRLEQCFPTWGHTPYKKNTIDAWWLYDDGGLNILLPYIIARRGTKNKMALRIFSLAKDRHNTENGENFMKQILAKFRIEYSELILIQDINEKPTVESWRYWNNIVGNPKNIINDDTMVTDTERELLHAKTSRHLRLRELMLERSSNAALIVMTLPYPRQAIVVKWREENHCMEDKLHKPKAK